MRKPTVLKYETLEEMLSQSDIQIVNICTPSGLHYKQVIAAANAGKKAVDIILAAYESGETGKKIYL